jgi:hypothetical protein
MVKNFAKLKMIFALALVILLVFVLMSACDIGRSRVISQPPAYDILAPLANASVLVHSPVQIQSAFKNADNISRVELWVRKADPADPGQLLRSDKPVHGVVRQQWQPQAAGQYVVLVRAYNANNELLTELNRAIAVIDDVAISVPAVAGEGQQAAGSQPENGASFQPPTQAQPTMVPDFAGPTPAPVVTTVPVQQAQDAAITIVATSTPQPTATPIPRYPPPPPAPGVPPGPTQAQLPLLAPPVCDAAQYLGVYVPNLDERIVITEDDDAPARSVGGTKVHRVWQIRNNGTCTWGPGYELAFYGGRSMGSGGVAFEGFFGFKPERRNFIEDGARLIVPEGKPNQVALLEVMLNVPVVPGIHQSYWRMRNPQGVYFGPIVGVTLEVVRECDFGIYGAPQINKFEILGVGDVFRPVNPVDVRAQMGETVTLDWSIINTENYDILVKEPTGSVTNLATRNLTDRRGFVPDELGRHMVTLIADNGSCTAKAEVKVDVVPPEGGEFTLDLLLAKNAPVSTTDTHALFTAGVDSGTLDIQWNHFDAAVNDVTLNADLYRGVVTKNCPLFGWEGYCQEKIEWQLEQSRALGQIGKAANGKVTVCQASETCNRIKSGVGPGENLTIAEHQQLIFCKSSTDAVKYGVKYYVRGRKDGRLAEPGDSNSVFVVCQAAAGQPGGALPTEIQ